MSVSKKTTHVMIANKKMVSMTRQKEFYAVSFNNVFFNKKTKRTIMSDVE